MAIELASVEKLRNFSLKGCKCNDPYTVIVCGVPRKVWEIADEIEREVSEKYAERTCRVENTYHDELWFATCTELSCGHDVWGEVLNYCPECGARVVE